MTLLRDIQETAVNTDSDVATLLRKCKILAARLGNAEFKHWVDQELKGYDDRASLPKYRILNVQSFGHFAGPFNSGIENAPIPPSCLPEDVQDMVSHSYLMEPISSFTSLIEGAKSKGANPREHWPADLTALVGRNIYQNMNCISAWKVIPLNAIVAIVDTIKTKSLDFCIAIEAEDPDAGEAPPNAPPISQDKVTQVFNTYITGNVQNVANGGSHFNQQATASFGGTDEMFRQLLEAINSMVSKDTNAQAMASAVEEMRNSVGTQSFGARYKEFVSLLADHIQVYGPLVAPYLPVLTSLVFPNG
ncbi:MAG: hypothetical protein ORN21_06935 [Methylophilaceae bacterium]|nr:hypothetical protein [Methylophilaceae bacterium]